jgi:phosphoglycolate phosphatase-like HAD superfamily hydrolase
MGRVNAAGVDAVTIDAYGTLATLEDPFGRLQALLPGFTRDAIERAFRAEAAYYVARVSTARDAASVRELREACVGVFNSTLGSDLSAEEYVGTMTFVALPGVGAALDRLSSLGLALAVVANWDFSLHERLGELALTHWFAAVVPAAGKPSPQGILAALRELDVAPERAVHIGDDEADAQAAAAAGVQFLPAPLAEAVASLD